ncbi:imidazole glycerol phosphate synthase subunit HisF [Lachnoclostridium sp. An131]|uniref:AglZ/HisF2 family acetamidino modification protein n=1 Tax=Lachnoclostridium sp. An131 TaxID=1965555 RepID=UPI000B365EF6|nr:AglZ/HisF2 family acetamidino modification protein [Lachnoclostridium sp. An131]OUQ27973.1 imidazole glycerol phosphate synthase subunit HisF [Lachnoclostridium sp. An131]
MYIRPRLIPCLSITGMKDLVKTTKFQNPRYLGDPINAVKIFNEKGVDELCVLDITASAEGRGPQMDYIKDIASEAFMPLSYGGGITTLDQIQKIFYMGYEKVVLNTAFYRDPDLITKAADYAGRQSIVVSIDVKTELFGKRGCYICDGKEKTKKDPVFMAKRAEELGAGEILLNSIDQDGMMQGYDLDLVRSVSEAVSIPVIACGGAGDLQDFKKVLTEGKAHAAAAGSLFVYYGEEKAVLINVPEEAELEKCRIYI